MIPFINIFLGISFGIMISAIAIAKILGKSNPSLEAWANIELSNLIINVFLLIFLLAFYNAFAAFSSIYISSNMNVNLNLSFSNIVDFVIRYLDQLLYEAIKIWFVLTKFVHDLKLLEGIEYQFGPAALGWKMNLFKGFGFLTGALGAFDVMFLAGYTTLIAQKLGIIFIINLSSTFLLPMGLVLRIIAPLRNVGNEMVSVAISFGIILPVLYYSFYYGLWEVEKLRNFNGYGKYVFEKVVKDMGGNTTINAEPDIPNKNFLSKFVSKATSITSAVGGALSFILAAVLPTILLTLYAIVLPFTIWVVVRASEILFISVIIPTFILSLVIASTKAVNTTINVVVSNLGEIL